MVEMCAREVVQVIEAVDGLVEDIDAAIASHTRALELTPYSHPTRASLRLNLALALRTKSSSQFGTSDDMTASISNYQRALFDTSSTPATRLEAGIVVTDVLSTIEEPDADARSFFIHVYSIIINLIPQVAWLGHNVNRRYEELKKIGDLSCQITASAIAWRAYTDAITLLESARSTVWSQAIHLRTPLDDLRSRHPEFAARLEAINRGLRGDVSSPSRISANFDGGISSFNLSVQAKNNYGLADDYEKLVTQIRSLDGFADFSRPKSFSQLETVWASSFIAVVNVDRLRCDAIVLYHSDAVHVPLPSFAFEQAEQLKANLRRTLKETNSIGRYRDTVSNEDKSTRNRGAKPRSTNPNDVLRSILAELWEHIVKPVLEAVRKLTTDISTQKDTLPHITWCPTGPLVFLPLHAAGIYGRNSASESIMDVAVSSYTPTLELLLRSPPSYRAHPEPGTQPKPAILVVSQPSTPHKSALPGTVDEAEAIRSIYPSSTTVLNDEKGTVDRVLSDIATYHWVHLACHGTQDLDDPTRSAFALHDGSLTLASLMHKDLPNAQIAVLSACQTATGDEKLSEEAVHLAAAMLYAGFKSVIGTMWAISDDTAPIVARVFYKDLRNQIREGKTLQPAYSLHNAVLQLRKKYPNDFMKWVPFAHFGL